MQFLVWPFHLDVSRRCICAFLDLAKAFDIVSIVILLKKLEGCGVWETTVKWFESYLSDGNQCLRVGHSYERHS